MERKISNNQACLIACLFILALKFSALPAIMFTFSGNDSYVACTIALVIDFIGTIILVAILTRLPNITFFELIKSTLGKVVEKIVSVVLLAYFLIKCVLTLQELHDYFVTTLYEDLKPLLFFIVVILFLFYVTMKDYRTMGRVLQIVFWPLIVCIFFTLVFPLGDIQLDRLLPVFEQGMYPIMQAIFRPMFAFGDFIIILLLMGRIDIKKGFKKSFLRCFILSFLFVSLIFIIFVGSFGNFAMNQTLALGELPLHSTTPSTIGKLEWLIVIVWTAVLLLNSGLLSISARVCIDNLIGVSVRKVYSIVITAIVIGIIICTYSQLDKLLLFLISPVFAGIATGIQLGLLTLAVVCYFVYKRKFGLNKSENPKANSNPTKKQTQNRRTKEQKKVGKESVKPNA